MKQGWSKGGTRVELRWSKMSSKEKTKVELGWSKGGAGVKQGWRDQLRKKDQQ